MNRPVGRAVTRLSLERKVCGSNLGPVTLDTVLTTVRHRGDNSKFAVLPKRNDAGMGPQTWYTLRRNTASTMTDLILIELSVQMKTDFFSSDRTYSRY